MELEGLRILDPGQEGPTSSRFWGFRFSLLLNKGFVVAGFGDGGETETISVEGGHELLGVDDLWGVRGIVTLELFKVLKFIFFFFIFFSLGRGTGLSDDGFCCA